MDIRKLKTQSAIKQEFFKLLKYKKLEEISVTEICKNALIGRMTFYLHYKDIYDLQKSLENEILKNLKEIFNKKENNATLTLTTRIKLTIDYLYDNEEEFKLLFTNNSVNKLASYSATIFLEEFYANNKTNYGKIEVSFVAYGIVGVLTQWLLSDKAITKDEFEVILLHIVARFIPSVDLS